MKMNTKMLIDDFLYFESEYGLFNIKINGIKIWHNIRMIIYMEVLQFEGIGLSTNDNPSSVSISKTIFSKLTDIPEAIKNSPLFRLKKKEILIFSHERRVKYDDIYGCIYTDSLVENLPNQNIVIGKSNWDKNNKIIKNKDRISRDYINILIGTKRELRMKIKNYDEVVREISELLSKIDDYFGVKINTDKIRKKILREVISYDILYRYYKNIIAKINPKVIVEVVNYDPHHMIINIVAKELDIPTVEFQHGTMGMYHLAYNFENIKKINSFPDYLFTFGQYWKDNTRLPIDKENIKVVGWPYFENKVSEYKSAINKKVNNKRTILFISQGTIGKELSKFAVHVSRVLDKDKYRIIYKLHPGEYNQWKHDYPYLKDTRVEVIDHNQKDMHYYFSMSDMQIGVYSTAIFEGLAYGLKTIIMKLYGHETMGSLYDEGIALLAENTEDIIKSCMELSNDTSINISKFWMENSVKNMINEIQNIIRLSDSNDADQI